jgi:hypothetical protein
VLREVTLAITVLISFGWRCKLGRRSLVMGPFEVPADSAEKEWSSQYRASAATDAYTGSSEGSAKGLQWQLAVHNGGPT